MKYRLKVKKDNGILENIDLALSQADQTKLDNAATTEYVQNEIAKIPEGPEGPQGPPGMSGSSDTFFNLHVEDNGDLYATYPDPAAQNNFELNENKDLYFTTDPNNPGSKFNIGNIKPTLLQQPANDPNEIMSAKATTDALNEITAKIDNNTVRVEDIKDNAWQYKFNQIIDFHDYYYLYPQYGINFSAYNELIKCRGTYNSTSTCFIRLAGVNLIKNHKYYINFFYRDNIGDADSAIISLRATGQQQINCNVQKTIFTANDNTPLYEFYFSTAAQNKKYDLSFKPIIIDLTEMFGAGKEPATLNELNNYIDANTYYPYVAIPTPKINKPELYWSGSLSDRDTIPIPQPLINDAIYIFTIASSDWRDGGFQLFAKKISQNITVGTVVIMDGRSVEVNVYMKQDQNQLSFSCNSSRTPLELISIEVIKP